MIHVGDIYVCDLGGGQGSSRIQKKRPVIVVKCEPKSGLLHVVPLTGNLNKPQNARHVEVCGFGLAKSSIALIEQVCLVDRNSLHTHIGCMAGSEELACIQAGLARYFNPDAA